MARTTGFLPVVTLMLCQIACGSLDSVEYVHDLRMLAARAEPPGQPFDPNLLGPGAASGASSTQQVALTALIADPKGQGRNIGYTFASCAALDSNSQRCLPSATDYNVFATGTTQATSGYVEISTSFTPTDAQLLHALAQDAYHGFDGLLFPVQITVQAGDEHVTGVKLVVYMPPYPGVTYTPSQNPNLAGMTVEGAPWPAAGFTFSSAKQPDNGWNIAPVFDTGAQATYQLPTFDGKILTFTENWLFDYFTTFAPGFSPSTAGGTQVATNVQNPQDSQWDPDATTSTKSGLFYFVARNGRGGENWLVLPATWSP